MRYVALAADFLEVRLKDEATFETPNVWDALSPSLKADLRRWNDDYQIIVPMSLDQRGDAASLIASLDYRGVELARRVEAEVGPAKVRYYSEGLLRNLP